MKSRSHIGRSAKPHNAGRSAYRRLADKCERLSTWRMIRQGTTDNRKERRRRIMEARRRQRRAWRLLLKVRREKARLANAAKWDDGRARR